MLLSSFLQCVSICIILLIPCFECKKISFLQRFRTSASVATTTVKQKAVTLESYEKFDVKNVLFRNEPETRKITKAYLHRKFFLLNPKVLTANYPHSCAVSCNSEEVKKVLFEILPPLSPLEMEYEVDDLMARVGYRESVDEYEFFQAIMSNSYWKAAGENVVKELIYLDSIRTLVQTGEGLLSDECLHKLKDDLECNMSPVVNYTDQDALLLFAISFHDRNVSIFSDHMYNDLCISLKDSHIMQRISKVKFLPEQNIRDSIIHYLFKYPVNKF